MNDVQIIKTVDFYIQEAILRASVECKCRTCLSYMKNEIFAPAMTNIGMALKDRSDIWENAHDKIRSLPSVEMDSNHEGNWTFMRLVSEVISIANEAMKEMKAAQ